jgi:hypothetical protein
MLHGAAFEHAEVNELSAMFISAQRNLSALNLPVRHHFGKGQRAIDRDARAYRQIVVTQTLHTRGQPFRHACETAPILIQDDELIVGPPCGKPRAGAFSPDIAWRWVRDELDTGWLSPLR